MRGMSEEERGFTATLEQVRRDYGTLADGQKDIRRRIDQIAKESMERDIDLDQKIDLHSAKLIERVSELKALVIDLSAKINGKGGV